MENSDRITQKWILWGVVLSSIVTFFVVLIRAKEPYTYLCVLPLSHAAIMIINRKIFHNLRSNVARLLLIGGYFIRNVITPLVFALAQFEFIGINTIRITEENFITRAVLLMAYESIFVFGGINYITRKLDNRPLDRSSKRTLPSGLSLYHIILIIIVAILIVAYIAVPSIKGSYSNMWTTDARSLIKGENEIYNYSAGSGNRLLYTFFYMFFPIARILLSAHLIVWSSSAFKQRMTGIIFSFALIGTNTLFVTESNAFTIYIMLILFIFMRTVFYENKHIINIIGMSGIFIVVIALLIARTIYYKNADNGFAVLGSLLNSYFPGINNVANIFRVEAPSKWICFYYDIYNSIPFQSLIPAIVEGERLAVYYNYAAGVGYQIIPLVAQSYFYFGLLCPLFELFFIYFALVGERKMKETNDYLILIAYITLAVIFSIGCVTYTFTSILTKLWKIILPCILLSYCTKVKLKMH